MHKSYNVSILLQTAFNDDEFSRRHQLILMVLTLPFFEVVLPKLARKKHCSHIAREIFGRAAPATTQRNDAANCICFFYVVSTPLNERVVIFEMKPFATVRPAQQYCPADNSRDACGCRILCDNYPDAV